MVLAVSVFSLFSSFFKKSSLKSDILSRLFFKVVMVFFKSRYTFLGCFSAALVIVTFIFSSCFTSFWRQYCCRLRFSMRRLFCGVNLDLQFRFRSVALAVARSCFSLSALVFGLCAVSSAGVFLGGAAAANVVAFNSALFRLCLILALSLSASFSSSVRCWRHLLLVSALRFDSSSNWMGLCSRIVFKYRAALSLLDFLGGFAGFGRTGLRPGKSNQKKKHVHCACFNSFWFCLSLSHHYNCGLPKKSDLFPHWPIWKFSSATSVGHSLRSLLKII